MIDPTCGSGAFLFAGLNILEPLYDACIDKMYDFKHEKPDSYKEFDSILEDIEKHPNREYFIYKSIILNNLYGVDIMKEATEIAKLRLFLKLASCAEVDYRKENFGLEALPDIDFNIRAGNSLVGFANYEEVKNAIFFNNLSGQVNFLQGDTMSIIDENAQKVSLAYKRFKNTQIVSSSHEKILSAKKDLQQRLDDLNTELNQYMAKKYGIDTDKEEQYKQWLSTHEPFNWFVEFYDVIHNRGGFDVIIGNPPYVEYSKVKKQYTIINYKTEECGNLYAPCAEQSLKLLKSNGNISMIIPISFTNTPSYKKLRELFKDGLLYCSNFSGDTNPGTMFDGVKHNLTIYIYQKNKIAKAYSTNFQRFYNEYRDYLFNNITYTIGIFCNYGYYKIGNEIQKSILNKILKNSPIVKGFLPNSNNKIYMKSTSGSHYKLFFKNTPFFSINGVEQVSSSFKPLNFNNEITSNCALSVFNSNLFNMWWCSLSDGRNVTSKEVKEFPFNITNNNVAEKLSELSKILMRDLETHSTIVSYNKQAGVTKYAQFRPRLSKPIIDEIDKVLAKHYGFTDEELDYIINYDIKYRMGDSLNGGNNEE